MKTVTVLGTVATKVQNTLKAFPDANKGQRACFYGSKELLASVE